MFFGNLLRKGVLRGFKHPNIPVLQVGAPGTILYGRKRRTRKEDKIVLDLYVGTKFIDWE